MVGCSRVLLARFAVVAGMVLVGVAALAQEASVARPLVRGLVNDTERVTLGGNVHPMARAGRDLGRVEDEFAVDGLYLILQRPAERQSALDAFMAEAHAPGRPGFHQWITPEEFGRRFGAADSDVAALTAWLESHGLVVKSVHPGRTAIEFSGNAAQVGEAFHTEIHRFAVRGGTAIANASDPQIPAAFAGLVKGISPMASLHAKALVKVAGKTSYNVKTHAAKPEWTIPGPTGGNFFELAPADFAVQYNVGPVYSAGTTGTGESIGIISASNIDLSMIAAYQAVFGLAANVPTVVIDGVDPGVNDAATEAYLDVEEAGAIAPGAQVVLYTSAGTVLTDPLLTSAIRAVEDNQVAVISMSYGNCEAALGAAGNAAWAQVWEEAAAQGISVFVSAGDGGGAGCDDFDSESFAESGLAVNGMGSTPFNVSVGGTDFYYSNYASGGSNLQTQMNAYWSTATSNQPTITLLKAAPEQVWNDAFGLNAGDAGLYSVNDSTILAGGGGSSSAAVTLPTGAVAGYAKPLWQSGTGVPADKVRDVPDVALFAANGGNYAYYPICAMPGDCVEGASTSAVTVTSVGGTSASAPAMAGIQALVDQATGARQGQADYIYYALATKTATAAATAKPFNDVTVGSSQVPCYAGTLNCALGGTGVFKGYYAMTGYVATTGYDRATGLGSVNVANLSKSWSTLAFKPTTTTLTISPATFAHGAAAAVSATVVPVSSTGTPTGNVTLTSNDTQAYSNGLGVFTLAGEAVKGTLNDLPGGSYQVVAHYGGDGVYGTSNSAPVTITVTAEKNTLTTSGWVLNPVDDYLYPLTAGMAIPYGSLVYVDAQPVGANEAALSATLRGPATGLITFTDKLSAGTKTGTANLNSVGLAEWVPASPQAGSHSITAAYAGDGSYLASASTTAVSFTVFKGTTTMTVTPLERTIAAGGNVTVQVVMESEYLPLNGVIPTGLASVTLGGQTLTSAWSSVGPTGSAMLEAVVTFTKVPAGILPLMATYAGDANWYGSATMPQTIAALGTRFNPTVALVAGATAVTPAQSLTLTGTVTGKMNAAAPTGLLTFTSADGVLTYTGALQALTANSAKYAVTVPAGVLANGVTMFTATYMGDVNYTAQSSTSAAVTVKATDFSVTTTTTEVLAPVGKPVAGSITVMPINAYSAAVAMVCTAPAGITCKPAATAPVVTSAGVVDALTLTVASGTAAGVYPVVVTVTGGGHTHTAQVLVAYMPPATTPSYSLAAGTYKGAQTLTITDATVGAKIYYTLDGTTPTTASALYGAPIQVAASKTIKTIAVASGYLPSTVGSAAYTIQ